MSRLGVEGFLTGDSERGVWQAEVAADNPTQQSVTAEFGARILPAGGDQLSSRPVEKTVAAGEETTFRIDIVDPTTLDFDQLTGVYFNGFDFQVTVDGEPRGELCPETDRSRPTDDGCRYPFGVDETHVEVDYEGNWQGSFGASGNVRSVSRASAPFGAPDGHRRSYVDIDDDASIVSANAQKRDGGSGELTIRIVDKDGVYAEQTTGAQYGVAQVTADLNRDDPIRTHESIEDGGKTSSGPTYTPEEFLTLLIETVYNDAQDRFETEEDVTRALMGFVHPDRVGEVSPGRGLPSTEAILDDSISFELVEASVLEEPAPDRVLVGVVYTQGDEQVERYYELRIGPPGEWMIWDIQT